MTYDTETFFDELQTFMIANLNTQITAINTEKADDIVLKSIDDSAYFFQSLDERVTNYNPFVFYGLAADVESDGIGPAIAKKLRVHISVISFDLNLPSIGKRYLRYNRALEEIFLSKWDRVTNHAIKIKIRNPILIDFTLMNTSDLFRVIGVELEANIA